MNGPEARQITLRDDRPGQLAAIRGRAHDAVDAAPAGYEVLVRKRKSKRSLQANAYMWALNTEAGKELGYSPAEMHELCKAAFGGTRKVTIGDITVEVLNTSTSKMSVEEFTNYIDWLGQYLTTEVGIDARALRRVHGV